MYLHKNTYKIRYTDVDVKDELKLSSLTSLMEESACLSADELHFGYDVLQPLNIGFVLVNWYVELFRPIRLKDGEITVTTWPIKPKKLIVLRDFELFVGDEKVGVATSRWCLVNLADFSVLATTAVFSNDNREYNDFRSVEFNSWKIEELENMTYSYSKTIRYSDYDHYNHANNTKYLDFLMDAFSVEEIASFNIKAFQITYVKQCKQGEKLDFYKKFTPDGAIVEGRVGDETRVRFKLKLDV